MKDFIKKLLVTVCAVSASVTLLTATVSATETARPMPGEDAAVTDQYTTSAGDQADVGADTAANLVTGGTVGQPNTVTTNTAQTASNTAANKKYQSRLGGFLWFLLSVAVNFIISCWIGNRFYKMARKSAQSSNEIRALRKDIEEKFASTLTDISEPTIDVLNQNENYARNDEGLTMPERRNHVELSDEERDMMRRWDKKRTNTRAAEDAEEFDEEVDYEDSRRSSKSAPRRAYQPTRRSSGIEFDDEEDYEDEEYEEIEEYEDRRSTKKRPSRMTSGKGVSKARSKAKRAFNNVFPFDED